MALVVMPRMSFDGQAAAFDDRAGLPLAIVPVVVDAIVALAGLGPDDLLLEVGAGSGEIGCRLAERVRYAGFDISPEMLAVFRARLGAHVATVRLELADGDASWPVAPASTRAIFASRSLHLLSLPHVLAEIERCGAHDGVSVLVGRVERSRDGVRMWMRREMRRALRDAGIEGRSGGGDVVQRMLDAAGRPCEPIAATVVARWTTTTSPADALAAWEGKDGLSGLAVPAPIKQAVLDHVRARALHEFGDLERSFEDNEHYVLAGVRFTGKVVRP